MTAIKHKTQRVGVFIDAQNLYHSAKNLYGKRVNFGNILETAVSDRSLVRALAYAITTETGEETQFLEALEKLGIEIKAKDLQVFFGGAKKGDWDVGLAVDVIKAAPKLDTVVLVSGDGDFIPLVEYLQHGQGCQVEVISFAQSSSSKLIEVCDDFTDLGEDPKRFMLYGTQYVKKTSTYSGVKKSPSSDTIKKQKEKDPAQQTENTESKTEKKPKKANKKTAKKPAATKKTVKKTNKTVKKETGGATIRKA